MGNHSSTFVHPAGFRSHVKFIQVVDALDIVAVVHGRPAVFRSGCPRPYRPCSAPRTLYPPSAKLTLVLGRIVPFLGTKGCLFLVQIIGVVQNGVADDGDCADMITPDRG